MMQFGNDRLTYGSHLLRLIMDARVKPGHDAEYVAALRAITDPIVKQPISQRFAARILGGPRVGRSPPRLRGDKLFPSLA